MLKTRGLVIGKFYPPHLGHHHLIDQAQQKCDHLTVLVAGSSAETIPLYLRARWISAVHPKVEVITTVDNVPTDYEDLDIWDAHVKIFRDATEPFEYLFSSERYGDQLAHMMNAKHVCIDPIRAQYDISGTEVRKDPKKHWMFLQSEVKEYLSKRIVVLGAESSGTTTLAQELSLGYEVPCVPEYGRLYSEDRGPDYKWDGKDFAYIAASQQKLEECYADHPLTICDTNALATCVFEELYLGYCDTTTKWIADQVKADLYIVTSDLEVPWEDDGTRLPDGHAHRFWMTKRLGSVLRENGVPWIEVVGTKSERIAQAKSVIDDVIDAGWSFGQPI